MTEINLATLNVTSANIILDRKTDVRVVVSSEIFLGNIQSNTGFKRTKEPIHLSFATLYLPDLEIYYTTWSLRYMSQRYEEQTRLAIVPWCGGLPVSVRSNAHFQEAIDAVVGCIVSNEEENNHSVYGTPPWNVYNYIITPAKECRALFIEQGWVEPVEQPIVNEMARGPIQKT